MATSAANAKAIADYWAATNGAALKAAKESNVWSAKDVAKLQSKGGYSSDTKPGSTKPIGDEKKTSAKSQNVNMPKTIGKVFFVNSKGERKWCSATSIQSKYKQPGGHRRPLRLRHRRQHGRHGQVGLRPRLLPGQDPVGHLRR